MKTIRHHRLLSLCVSLGVMLSLSCSSGDDSPVEPVDTTPQPGHVYTWAGNREVGEGRMTVTESRPPERIKIALEFVKPFRAESQAEFVFVPSDAGTNVTWSMEGDVNFVAKVVHLFMDMDRMFGGNFEKGLADMKAVVEAQAAR